MSQTSETTQKGQAEARPATVPRASRADGAGAAGRGQGAAWPWVALASLLFLAAVAAVSRIEAYVPGFDDLEHLNAAAQWRRTTTLASDGLFVRVPLWMIAIGTVAMPIATLHGPELAERYAVLAIQLVSVLGAFALYAVHVRQRAAGPDSRTSALSDGLPLLLLALSPQLVLYTRQAVNELAIGALGIGVVVLAWALTPRRAFAAGVLCGVAFGIKLAALVLALPALVWAWQRGRGERVRLLAAIAIGFALVAAPLYALHEVQRGALPFDNTSAYNLSAFTPQEWNALGDPSERRDAALAAWRGEVAAAPLGALVAVFQRLGHWIATPSSADFALYYRDYPHRWIQALDLLVFFALSAFAVLGTDRRSWPIWLPALAFALAACAGFHVPRSPKATWLFFVVLLAPAGLRSLVAYRAAAAPSAAKT